MITSTKKCATSFKRGFSLLELIFAILLIALITSFIVYKKFDNSLDIAAKRVLLYLKYTRHKALIDDRFDPNDDEWSKKRYSFRLRRCNNKSGIYYTIHSDKNANGHITKEETLKDPLTGKYIYSANTCNEVSSNSKYVLLTKLFSIVDAKISCNDTSSLGLISFGNDGRVYSKIDTDPFAYEIKQTCYITLVHKSGESKTIAVEPLTGFIYLQ